MLMMVFEYLLDKLERRRLRQFGGLFERYEKIGFRESLSISHRYPIACQELSSVILLTYSSYRKSHRSLIFQDVLFAFRLLPEMETESAVSAAHNLMKSVEAVLPKQKRLKASKEFKKAIVAPRLNKCQQENHKVAELPQDILLHLFSFLDMQSLVSAGAVCRLWNAVASDNFLWKAQFFTYFIATRTSYAAKQTASTLEAAGSHCSIKNAFRKKYQGTRSRKLKTNRAYCMYCNNLVWLSDLKCPNSHVGSAYPNSQLLSGMSASHVADFVRYGRPSKHRFPEIIEPDEESGWELWAYPKELTLSLN